jgi:argininosuccinate lyase
LWCRDAINVTVELIILLQVALVKLGLRNEGLIVPGYTHLQRAQPLLLQHVLLAFVEQVEPWNVWGPMSMALLCT